MPRHFFYSVRLFAGGFPFAVARIVFESQNTGVEPRNTLSTFFRVHSCAFVIQKNTLSTCFSCSFVVLTLPLLSFSCVSCFSWLNPSFPIRVHSCPFVVLTLPLLSLSCVSCFSWLNPSFPFRVHSCTFVVLTLLLLSLSCVSCVSWFKKHTIYIFSWFVPSFSILQSVMPSLKIAISWQWLTSLRARVSPDAIVRTVSRNSSTFGFAMASQSIQCGFFCARE